MQKSSPAASVLSVHDKSPIPARRPSLISSYLPALPSFPATLSHLLSLLESSLRSKPALLAFLSSFFLLLLLHQILLPKPPSPSAAASASSSPHPTSTHQARTTTRQAADRPRPHSPPVDDRGDETRIFRPYGSAAALFVVYGAYRGGPNTFAVVGLGSKPLYVYGKPNFECYWLPSASAASSKDPDTDTDTDTDTDAPPPIKSKRTYSMLPDYGFGRVYTVVVVNCTFEEDVGTLADQRGGQLVLYATHGDGLGKPAERIVALTEDEHSYNASIYKQPYPYEFLYCGSPLYSNLNAQRIREWIAYHVMFFGPKSHFIFHDAGGMLEDVRAVLEPWKKKGYITIQNVKQTTQYDGYYYNQFLIVNDCLHRTRFMANWTFFFDVDEFMYVGPGTSLRKVLNYHASDTLLSFKQLRMSDALCQFKEPKNDSRWIFEKLVYGEQFRDIKYAVQARGVFATGVHYSQKELRHMQGNIGWVWWPHMHFYHYHNTISKHGKLCQNITNNATTFALAGR
ncbi:hypothetical protein GOP47_0003262 [Adiantum capillus-veneris]|uniref:Glycosyltransferase family 92 protein n=1 Tax=Adiantum capillus-veneris TaxID=13818 RepID=A0A9D4VBW8_ADICA|nr:hypothetical protein GOP47_0003262 [Adiantum capillus-veneris]